MTTYLDMMSNPIAFCINTLLNSKVNEMQQNFVAKHMLTFNKSKKFVDRKRVAKTDNRKQKHSWKRNKHDI